MEERFLSQRQFAKMASISPATLQKLIADKEIKVDPATGKISSLEYQNILMNELKTYKSKNTLIVGLCSDADEEEVAHALALKIVEKYPQRYFTDLVSIFDTITGDTITSDAKEDIIQYEYNKRILKEFSSRYKNMVKTYKMSVLDNRKSNINDSGEFYRLPYFITDELFMYGRVISVRDDDEKMAIEESIKGVANMNKEIQDTLNNKFKNLMLELRLANQTNMLFQRTDLSPEFFNETGDLYNIFFKGEKPGELAAKIPVNEEIYSDLVAKHDNMLCKDNIHNLLSNGFVIDKALNLSNIDRSWIQVSVLLYSGLFANVIILADEEAYNTAVPDYIKQAITVAQATAKFSIEFM